MNSLLGFYFSPPVINPLSDSSLTCLGQQSGASGSHKQEKGSEVDLENLLVQKGPPPATAGF